jgi:hypothetical protein
VLEELANLIVLTEEMQVHLQYFQQLHLPVVVEVEQKFIVEETEVLVVVDQAVVLVVHQEVMEIHLLQVHLKVILEEQVALQQIAEVLSLLIELAAEAVVPEQLVEM